MRRTNRFLPAPSGASYQGSLDVDQLISAESYEPTSAGFWLQQHAAYLRSGKTQQDTNFLYSSIFDKDSRVQSRYGKSKAKLIKRCQELRTRLDRLKDHAGPIAAATYLREFDPWGQLPKLNKHASSVSLQSGSAAHTTEGVDASTHARLQLKLRVMKTELTSTRAKFEAYRAESMVNYSISIFNRSINFIFFVNAHVLQ